MLSDWWFGLGDRVRHRCMLLAKNVQSFQPRSSRFSRRTHCISQDLLELGDIELLRLLQAQHADVVSILGNNLSDQIGRDSQTIQDQCLHELQYASGVQVAQDAS